MRLAPGTRLGPYEIVGPLGAGGMGEVYRAKDTRLNRTVAIKVLPPALAGDAQFRSRFKREAAAIGSLNHPHICVLHDIGDHDGVGYLVMEHVEGETLADRLRRGPLPFDQALAFGIEMADALARAHQHGIVHRDLKPGNVMLTRSGTKLLDFGLARVAPLPADSGRTTRSRPMAAGSLSPTCCPIRRRRRSRWC
jgi:serine/threonine protein kinase